MTDIEADIARAKALIKRADKALADPNLSPKKRAAAKRVKAGMELMLAHRQQRQQCAGSSENQVPNIQPVPTATDDHQEKIDDRSFLTQVKNVFLLISYDSSIDYTKLDYELWSRAGSHIEKYVHKPLPWYFYVLGLFIWGSFSAGLAFGSTPPPFGELTIFIFSFFFGFWFAAEKLETYKELLREEYWRLEAIKKSESGEVPP
ncbi:hypothetical protein [Profundibacter sp.]